MLAAKGGSCWEKKTFTEWLTVFDAFTHARSGDGLWGYRYLSPTMPNQSAELAPEPIIVHFIQILILKMI